MTSIYRGVVLIGLVLSSSIFGQAPLQRTVVAGLEKDVTVRRDGRGIPYIEASSDADIYFAQGYTTASDRLWQMDLLRRLARGETAEIFGKAVLEEDKRWRRFGFSAIAEASLAQLSPELKTALDNYARGVNAYMSTLDKAKLPVEFQILQYQPKPWKATDTIVIGKILADALSTSWRNDLLRASLQAMPADRFAELSDQVTPYDVILFGDDRMAPKGSSAWKAVPVSDKTLAIAETDADLRANSLKMIGLYAEELSASNNWVISGKRTADGKPILANDPHLAPAVPGIWYLTHLSTPKMRVAGVTFPGVPGIVLGHNEHIAWGATNVAPDVQDLYIETFNERGEYKRPSGWEKPTIRKEVIAVRENPLKPETTPIEFEVVETANGVIIAEEGGKRYALRWTARDPRNSEFESFFSANRARNWEEFKAALKKYGGATQNFVYADVSGNIGWYAAGRIPIRRKGDGALPYDGSTTDGDWTGYIPFDELPHLYNPSSGLIVTANQRIVGTSYKYPQMSHGAAPPWRARRIYDLLNAESKITREFVSKVQADDHNLPLANLAAEVVKIGSASPETTEVLKEWNGRMDAESKGALLANEMRGCLADRMAESYKPAPAYFIRERILEKALKTRSARWLPTGNADYGQLVRDCDRKVRVDLADPKRFGPDASGWVWGKAWQSRFNHPLASVPFIGGQFAIKAVPINGSGQSPNVGSAVSMRFVTSPGSWDATRFVIPLGQSGDPRSANYKDQFEAWASGNSPEFPFSKPAVERSAAGLSVLAPR